ncbi:MAG: O-antigen ligase family protein [Ignavibacteriaceae bacterium]
MIRGIPQNGTLAFAFARSQLFLIFSLIIPLLINNTEDFILFVFAIILFGLFDNINNVILRIIYGTFISQGLLGTNSVYSGINAGLLLPLYYSGKFDNHKKLIMLLIILSISLCVLSLSRTSFVVISVVSFLLFIIYGFKSVGIIIRTVVVFGLVSVLFVSFNQQMLSRFGYSFNEQINSLSNPSRGSLRGQTTEWRLQQYSYYIDKTMENNPILGAGFGNPGFAENSFGIFLLGPIHSIYIYLLYATGLLGLSFFLFILAVIYFYSKKILRRIEQKSLKFSLISGFLIATFAVAAQALTFPMDYSFTVVLGGLIAAINLNEK